jgi:hypothetical protein
MSRTRVGRGFYDGALKKSIKISRDFIFTIENFTEEAGRYVFDIGDSQATCRGSACLVIKNPAKGLVDFCGVAVIDLIQFFVEAKRVGEAWSFIFSSDKTLKFINDNLYYVKKGGGGGTVVYSKRIFDKT